MSGLPGYVTMEEAARYYIGKPWLEGGRSDIGIDCAGHVTLSAHRAGFPLDPNHSFGRQSPPVLLRTQILKFAVDVKPAKEGNWQVSDLKVGDVAVYQDLHDGVHLGIITSGNFKTPLQVCFVPFKKNCTEVPIYLSEYRFRWVFRFPYQDS